MACRLPQTRQVPTPLPERQGWQGAARLERPGNSNENLGPRLKGQAQPESRFSRLHRLLRPTSQFSPASYPPMSPSGHEYERRLLGQLVYVQGYFRPVRVSSDGEGIEGVLCYRPET
jgi:hypothetical protein